MTTRSSLPKAPRCTAHRSNGEPCKAFAIRGASVCVTHGGAAKQVRERARQRLAGMIDPALDNLAKLLVHHNGSVRLRAIENVLDRNDLGVLREAIEAHNQVTIQVQYAEVELRPERVIDVKQLEDGHANGTNGTSR